MRLLNKSGEPWLAILGVAQQKCNRSVVRVCNVNCRQLMFDLKNIEILKRVCLSVVPSSSCNMLANQSRSMIRGWPFCDAPDCDTGGRKYRMQIYPDEARLLV